MVESSSHLVVARSSNDRMSNNPDAATPGQVEPGEKQEIEAMRSRGTAQASGV